MELEQMKTGAFGYRKQDVSRYISEQNERYALLEKENEKLKQELEEGRTIKKLLEDSQSRESDLSRERDALLAQVEDLKRKLAEKEEQDDILREAGESISTAILHAEKYAAAVRKQADEKAEQIRQKAETDAAEILRRSGADAQHQLEEAAVKSEEQLHQASIQSEQMLSKAKQQQEAVNGRVDEIHRIFFSAREQMQNIFGQIDTLLSQADIEIPDDYQEENVSMNEPFGISVQKNESDKTEQEPAQPENLSGAQS